MKKLKKYLFLSLILVNSTQIMASKINVYNKTGKPIVVKLNLNVRNDPWFLVEPDGYFQHRGVSVKEKGASVAVKMYEDFDKKKFPKKFKPVGYKTYRLGSGGKEPAGGKGRVLASATYKKAISTPRIKDKSADVIVKHSKNAEGKDSIWVKVVIGEEGY